MRELSTSSVSDPEKELQEISASLLTRRIERDILSSTREELASEINEHNAHLSDLKLIETFLTRFADERQAQVYKQIEHTVSEGLLAVFDEDIKLEVSNKVVGARSETVFTVVSNTEEGELRTSIMDARGGGVAAIVGFLIQAVLVLLTPNLRPILFLDETFRNVSEEFQSPLGEFIKDLCERTGLQVVLVTHQPTIAEFSDSWYAFSQTDGKTKIKKVV